MDCQLRIISTEATPSVIFISDYPGTGSDGVRECFRYRQGNLLKNSIE
jgi:hypothetical protein